jgi:hypothetical protein
MDNGYSVTSLRIIGMCFGIEHELQAQSRKKGDRQHKHVMRPTLEIFVESKLLLKYLYDTVMNVLLLTYLLTYSMEQSPS